MNQSPTPIRTIILSGLAISATLAAIYLFLPRTMDVFQLKTIDWVMRGTVTRPTEDIAIVDLDEKSLAAHGQWPWPRYRLADLLQKINDMGARSIALTIILSEPDRTSPATWQESIGRELGYHVDLKGDPDNPVDHDEYLAETLRKGPYVLGLEFRFKEAAPPRRQACRLHPLTMVRVYPNQAPQPASELFEATDVICNLGVFSQAVGRSGFLNAVPDTDGILRRMPLLIQYQGNVYPSLALAALMHASNTAQVRVKKEPSGAQSLHLGERSIPVDRRGNLLINFNPGKHRRLRVSALDVMEGAAEASALRDKWVLIGSSAAGWEQVYQTPGSPVSSAVEVHACALETLSTERFVVRRPAFRFWEALAGLLVALACSLCVARLGITWSAVAGTAAVTGMWVGARALFQTSGALLSPLFPTVAVVVNVTFLTMIKSWNDVVRAKAATDDTLVLLKSSENTLNAIVKTIPDIVFRLDTKGRVVFISPAITKYTRQIEDVLGRPIFDLVASEDHEKAKYRINERRTGERATVDLELRMTLSQRESPAGEDIRYFRVSAEGIYHGRGPTDRSYVGTQGIARDITEQKKLEDQLMQAQKMEVIGNLAAGVAHDLNNILSGLVSYPDLLLLELPKDSPLRDNVKTIQQSGIKAAAIVQDLLTLARRGVSINEVVNLNDIVQDYLASPESEKIQKDHPQVAITLDLADDLMDIKGSPLHISKALMNAIINATEAMPAGGRIRLSTGNRYLDAPAEGFEAIPEGEYVCLDVVDDGIGIAESDLKQVFEPFFTKKSMNRSGSGLGMTVIWATVKDHGGYVDVNSSEGEGTRISVYLPATREKAGIENRRRVVLEDFIGTEDILVVDDIQEQREIAEKMLGKLGYSVFTVPSGEAAVEFLRTQSVDLVVLDMIMPGGIDGLETYQRILTVKPGQKAVIASGFSESDRVRSLQQLGAGDYVQKPYTLEKIGMVVRRELDRAAP